MLRTGFHWEECDEPFQVVFRNVPLPWIEQDWSDASEPEQAARLIILLGANRAEPFDLHRPPFDRPADRQRHLAVRHASGPQEFRAQGPDLRCRAHVFIADRDEFIQREMAALWSDFIGGGVTMHELRGNHMLDRDVFDALPATLSQLWFGTGGAAMQRSAAR